MRKWLAQHPAAAWIGFGLVILIFVALYLASRRTPGAVAVSQVYFYDLTKKELFAASSLGIPPIQAPSDKAGSEPYKGARAFVFSCGDCGKPADRTIGWLEVYTPDAKKKLEPLFGPNRPEFGPRSPEEMPGLLGEDEHLISKADGVDWVDANSGGATTIRQDAIKPCPSGERPKECMP